VEPTDPAVVAVTDPIFTGEAKEPEAFESCAVKTLPEVNVPVMV
jgi:hypothetical protein